MDLDNLDNASLRLKCIEYGLPNVPVTDTSRKLLLKRLREAINNNASKETATKTSNRRETMHVTKTKTTNTTVETIGESAAPAPNVGKSRRTIAATVITPAPIITKDDAAVAAPTSIPISTRRRSSQKDTEPIKSSKGAVKQMPTIVIEDDEEDIDLLAAVENAEKHSTTSSVPIETVPSSVPTRRKSRSASVPKVPLVTEVITIPKKRGMTPLIEDFQEIATTEIRKQMHVTTSKASSIVEKQLGFSATTKVSTTQPIPTSVASAQATFTQPLPKSINQEYTHRYSFQNTTPSLYSTPSMRYSVGPGAIYDSASSSAYRSKYLTSNLLNEQSDTDGNNDDDGKSPFLSSFARNLERSRSVGRTTTSGSGGTTGRYARHSGSNLESIHGRRASQHDVTIGQFFRSLNRKYHLKTIIVVLAILCVSIFVYVVMNRPVNL